MPPNADSSQQSSADSSQKSASANEWASIVIGFILVAGVIAGVFYGVTKLYALLSPAPVLESRPAPPAGSVSLSAYFDKSPGQQSSLKIAGEVQQAGKPVNEGKVKLTVQKGDGIFRQSTLLPLTQGTFAASPETVPSFRAIEPGEPIRILAQVWSPEVSDGPLTEEVNLDVRAPLLAAVLPFLVVVPLVVLSCIFLVVFTGQQSDRKDRVAIGLSYFIAILLLGLSLAGPVVIPLAFPDLIAGMEKTPVGFLVTKVDAKPESVPQWALNIGGSTTRIDDTSNAPVVKVEGGLVIPLYVLILSIIGGAINMTRQLPTLQYQGEKSAIQLRQTLARSTPGRIGSSVLAVSSLLRRQPATATTGSSEAESQRPARGTGPSDLPEAQQEDTEAEGQRPARGTGPSDLPGARREDTEAPASTTDAGHRESHEETSTPAIDWRTELLNQYMYLIGAPFLAIVTFYLLLWLNLDRVPIVVLVSFSVGLISAPILSRITGIASGLIRTDRMEPAAGGRPAGSTTTLSTTAAPP
jgi:hypothetical protein